MAHNMTPGDTNWDASVGVASHEAGDRVAGVGLHLEDHRGEVLWRRVLRVFLENRLALVGALWIGVTILFCFIGPAIYHPNEFNAEAALQSNPTGFASAPSLKHLFGTDPTGFDELGRLMVGGQISLEVGFAAAGIATAVGVCWGAVAGFLGGWVDAVMMRIVDTCLSIPTLLVLIVLAVIFRPTVWLLILVLAGVAWLVPARLVRAEALTLRSREYVEAVGVMGGRRLRMIFRHVVPNAVGTIIVNLTFQIADAILYLAALGFLGIGVEPPQTDWGAMLASGINYATSGYWWLIYPAGGAILLVVVAFNFIGDALRDALEVRLQRR